MIEWLTGVAGVFVVAGVVVLAVSVLDRYSYRVRSLLGLDDE